ncbi:hypothetical protein CR513_10055, partial [Mucuna pruriens]
MHVIKGNKLEDHLNPKTIWTWLCFSPTRMSLSKSSLYSIKEFKMKKVLALSLSKVVMGKNLKMKTFKSFVKNMTFFIIFPIQEHLNKMKSWKGKNASF